MPWWIETSLLEVLIYPQCHQAEVLDSSISQGEGCEGFEFDWGKKEVGLIFGVSCSLKPAIEIKNKCL